MPMPTARRTRKPPIDAAMMTTLLGWDFPELLAALLLAAGGEVGPVGVVMGGLVEMVVTGVVMGAAMDVAVMRITWVSIEELVMVMAVRVYEGENSTL